MGAPEPPPDLEARIDAGLDELGAVSAAAHDRGEELLAAVVQLHTPALAALLDRLREAGGDQAVDATATDPVIGPILALHDLQPVSEPGCGKPAAPMATIAAEPVETLLPLPKLRTPTTPVDALPAPSTDGCELCGGALANEHGHGVDVEQRRLVCLCDPCRIVLGANPDGRGRFRALPDRVVADPEFARADGEWEALGIPVSTAFFFHDSAAGGIVAFYPGPAGATESLLGAQQWEDLARTSPVASGLAPDTEAMLVRRTADTHESYLVPVDRCYELVGLLRLHWRGFDGGAEAHDALDEFFTGVRAEARATRPEAATRA
jgi:hypothetical protein